MYALSAIQPSKIFIKKSVHFSVLSDVWIVIEVITMWVTNKNFGSKAVQPNLSFHRLFFDDDYYHKHLHAINIDPSTPLVWTRISSFCLFFCCCLFVFCVLCSAHPNAPCTLFPFFMFPFTRHSISTLSTPFCRIIETDADEWGVWRCCNNEIVNTNQLVRSIHTYTMECNCQCSKERVMCASASSYRSRVRIGPNTIDKIRNFSLFLIFDSEYVHALLPYLGCVACQIVGRIGRLGKWQTRDWPLLQATQCKIEVIVANARARTHKVTIHMCHSGTHLAFSHAKMLLLLVATACWSTICPIWFCILIKNLICIQCKHGILLFTLSEFIHSASVSFGELSRSKANSQYFCVSGYCSSKRLRWVFSLFRNVMCVANGWRMSEIDGWSGRSDATDSWSKEWPVASRHLCGDNKFIVFTMAGPDPTDNNLCDIHIFMRHEIEWAKATDCAYAVWFDCICYIGELDQKWANNDNDWVDIFACDRQRGLAIQPHSYLCYPLNQIYCLVNHFLLQHRNVMYILSSIHPSISFVCLQ